MELIQKENKIRNSNVELLKLIAVFFVVLCHSIQSLQYSGFIGSDSSYIQQASSDYRIILLSLGRVLGGIGDCIFILSAVYFAILKDANYKKILRIAFDTFFISILFLLIYKIFAPQVLNDNLINKSITPIIHRTNWFVSTYILFILLLPLLNLINKKASRTLLAFMPLIVIALSIPILLIVGINKYPIIFPFTAIFFIFSYLKIYKNGLYENKQLNIKIAVISFVLFVVLYLFFNYLCLKINNKEMMEYVSYALYVVVSFFVFGIFNVARLSYKGNKIINYFSSFSLLVYLIHENIIFRDTRVSLIRILRNSISDNYIVITILLFAICLFIATYLVAIVYKYTIQKLIYFISDSLYKMIDKLFNKIKTHSNKR